jgi:hypothetical protein
MMRISLSLPMFSPYAKVRDIPEKYKYGNTPANAFFNMCSSQSEESTGIAS